MNNTDYFLKGGAIVVLAAAAILDIPLVAMQFSGEVDWKLFDFLVMGVLLVGTGFMFVVGCRLVGTTGGRIIIGAVLGLALLLTWTELAVGWLGTPFAGS
ncbi:MAG: hypothetical protein V4633_25245 [Pseudomonadota bacterium]